MNVLSNLVKRYLVGKGGNLPGGSVGSGWGGGRGGLRETRSVTLSLTPPGFFYAYLETSKKRGGQQKPEKKNNVRAAQR